MPDGDRHQEQGSLTNKNRRSSERRFLYNALFIGLIMCYNNYEVIIMNLSEYKKIEGLNYLEYCDYLQKKYGIGLCDYMRTNWTKNPKVTRTKEGLYAHHKYEDHAILLSRTEYAQKNPYDWQKKENIVYCDWLEHLFLHILICENPSENKNANENVGFGGVVNFLVPELNDVYSGWIPSKAWQLNCRNVILDDKEVYMLLLKRFKELYNNNPFIINNLYRSWNEQFGNWSNKNNYNLYEEINEL